MLAVWAAGAWLQADVGDASEVDAVEALLEAIVEPVGAMRGRRRALGRRRLKEFLSGLTFRGVFARSVQPLEVSFIFVFTFDFFVLPFACTS